MALTNNANRPTLLHGVMGQVNFLGIQPVRSLLHSINPSSNRTIVLHNVSAGYEGLDGTSTANFRKGLCIIGKIRNSKASVDAALNVPLTTIARTEQLLLTYDIYTAFPVEFNQGFVLKKTLKFYTDELDILLTMCEDTNRPTSSIQPHLGLLTVVSSIE